MITQEQIDRVIAVVDECTRKIIGHSLEINIRFCHDMGRCAGIAYYDGFKIDLNLPLFLNNEKEFLSVTIPHEVAHLLTWMLHPNAKQNHGPEFKKILSQLSSNTSTYHSMDVSVATGKPRFRYVCCCPSRVHFISSLIHKKMSSGQARFCGACKERILFETNEGIK